MKKLKNYLLAGLLVWLPIGLTFWIITSLIRFVDHLVPNQITSQAVLGINFPGAGLVIVLVGLLLTGVIATNFLGQTLINFSNKIIMQIPLVKSIYKGVKQVSDTLLSNNSKAFRKALLIRFPHQDAWTIAFITGTPQNIAATFAGAEEEYFNVYIPTTPNPTSGYFLIVKKSDTRELNLSVDEALRYVISMGTVSSK